MKKVNYIQILIFFSVFISINSYAQIVVEQPELFKKEVLNDSISQLYSVEYNSSDSNMVCILKYYPSGQINYKWTYTSFSDTLINKFETWYENGNLKRIFVLNPDIDQKKLNKFLSKRENSYWFYHVNRYYNGDLKTYRENGQIKRHDDFSDGVMNLGSTWNRDGEIAQYYAYDIKPEFPGGEAAFARFIINRIKYPVMAQEYGIQGKVYITFVVEADGTITNISVAESVAQILDDEAVRVIKSMPAWIPGKLDGENVRTSYTIPVGFNIK